MEEDEGDVPSSSDPSDSCYKFTSENEEEEDQSDGVLREVFYQKIIIFIKILTYSKNYNFIINYYMLQKAYASPHRHENASPYAFAFTNIGKNNVDVIFQNNTSKQ